MAVALQLVLLPVHLLISWAYFAVRHGSNSKQWRFYDWTAVALSFVAWAIAAWWGQHQLYEGGPMWPYILAVLAGYLAFNGVLWSFWVLRYLRVRQARRKA